MCRRSGFPGGGPSAQEAAPSCGSAAKRRAGAVETDTGRLLELYAQAVALGLVATSEWSRLRFVAAAEHARAIGTTNPCGLFARLVRGGSLHFATEGDEQAVRELDD